MSCLPEAVTHVGAPISRSPVMAPAVLLAVTLTTERTPSVKATLTGEILTTGFDTVTQNVL